MDEEDVPPADMPQFTPIPLDFAIMDGLMTDQNGKVWCVATFVTGNYSGTIMTDPEQMKAVGERLIGLATKGRQAKRERIITPPTNRLLRP